jgi:hypothetical protein
MALRSVPRGRGPYVEETIVRWAHVWRRQRAERGKEHFIFLASSFFLIIR